MTLPIRVCLISQLYLEPITRRKLTFLAKGVSSLSLITPNSLVSAVYGVTTSAGLETEDYDVFCHSPIFLGKRNNMRWCLRSLTSGLRDLQPDIIHIENELHSLIVLQTLLQRRLFSPKSRVVVSIWANQKPPGFKRLLLAPLYRLLRTQVDLLLTGSREGREIFTNRGWRASGPLPLVGVNTGVFYPYSAEDRARLRDKTGVDTNGFVVGYVGRFVEEKGVLDLTLALKRFGKNCRRTQLVMIGDGQLRAELEDRARKHPNIKLISTKPRMEMPRWLNLFDVLVLPSRTRPFWKEQFGRVLIEAMACGVPVVGSNSGAIPEVIGDAGLIFAEGKIEALVLCLEQLYSDADFREDLIIKGLNRVREKYTDKAIAAQTLGFYRKVILNREETPISSKSTHG